MVCVCRSDCVDNSRRIYRKIVNDPQPYLVRRIPCLVDDREISWERICRRSQYTFEYSDEGYTITGIACLPVSEEIQSPEPEVVTGGLNQSYVSIRLIPQMGQPYSCEIIIRGIEKQTSV